MKVSVERAFGSITLQDGGRPGSRHEGIPLGGYADRQSARLARALLGELGHGPIIEFAQARASLRFSGPAIIAWTGAGARLSIGGAPAQPYTRHYIPADSLLEVTGPYEGRFGYLAIGGVWQTMRYRGSVSPIRLGEDWCPTSSVLKTGSAFQLTAAANEVAHDSVFSKPQTCATVATVELWPGPESEDFQMWIAGHPSLLAYGLPRLRDMVWSVSSSSNRVGVRLRHACGQSIVRLLNRAPIRSSPTIPGTVQVTPIGELIVALVDGPTMGGYPRLGIVAEGELDIAAQATRGLRLLPRGH